METDTQSLDQDPRKLLPFSIELEPHDPNVERLPFAFKGTGKVFEALMTQTHYPHQN